MGKALEFEVLNKDFVIAFVRFDYAKQKLHVENYGKNFMDSAVLGEAASIESIHDWFEERCFPRTRADKEFLLSALGLTEYAPYNIVRKTNGVLFEDTYWIRFKDQPNLTWANVDPRRQN